ncbi:hypothetical protein DFJ77DRAFT_474160 [Powellomyces hirtus]|nr:hypothetical protein DFJ77DRAFT_474160 [Powellomyces hirtus]
MNKADKTTFLSFVQLTLPSSLFPLSFCAPTPTHVGQSDRQTRTDRRSVPDTRAGGSATNPPICPLGVTHHSAPESIKLS